MDRQRFLNLLKNLQTIMRCPSCGSVYTVQEVQYLGNQDGYFLLSMTCSKCSLPVWVNFYAGGSALNDLTVADLALSKKEPISNDEVIDFHRFIRNFDGNFKRLIKLKK